MRGSNSFMSSQVGDLSAEGLWEPWRPPGTRHNFPGSRPGPAYMTHIPTPNPFSPNTPDRFGRGDGGRDPARLPLHVLSREGVSSR
jgi:hypothetical protein